jgi:hypothetical protein
MVKVAATPWVATALDVCSDMVASAAAAATSTPLLRSVLISSPPIRTATL